MTPDLRVERDALPIEGLGDNLSGLTWSDRTQSLFAVLNAPPTVVELSPEGRLLRQIPILNAKDTEGITFVEGSRFLIVDEADQSIDLVEIGPDTREIVLGQGPKLGLDFGFQRNMGFEGVSWDSLRQTLFLVQEMLPLRVLKVEGLADAFAGAGFALRISDWPLDWRDQIALVDLSSVTLHEASGHLLLLSHMSGMLVELDAEGQTVASLSLREGQAGLGADIPQAEGLAVDGAGRVFIVSEPNLFYRFAKP